MPFSSLLYCDFGTSSLSDSKKTYISGLLIAILIFFVLKLKVGLIIYENKKMFKYKYKNYFDHVFYITISLINIINTLLHN